MTGSVSPECRAVEPAPDYTSADAWAVHRPETASGLSVFYVHPTSYIRATTWNQPLSQGRVDRLLFGQMIPKQVAPFAEHALFAPHYRQAAFYVLRALDKPAVRAIQLARGDVRLGFEQFLREAPTEKIALVGHSQGALHLMGVLASLSGRQTDLDRIVAAYLIGYPIPLTSVESGELALPLCATPKSTRCLLGYNARGPNAYIPGLFLRVPVVDRAGYRHLGDEPIVCWSPIDALSAVSGACAEDSWLELLGVPERFTRFLMSKEWYHTAEIPLFERELREDLARRLRAAVSGG